LVTPDADLLFFCKVYYFDENFNKNHPRKFELKLVNVYNVNHKRKRVSFYFKQLNSIQKGLCIGYTKLDRKSYNHFC
jgi:hypothetical protein